MMTNGLEALGGKEEIPQVLKFYDGAITLEYHDKLHAYYRIDGDKKILVPGVTSAVGIIDKSGPLTQWAANMCCDYLRESTSYKNLKIGDEVKQYVEKADLESLFNQARYNYRKAQKTATDIGKLAHEWLEDCLKAQINGATYVAPLPSDEKSAKCVQSALEWMHKHDFKPLQSERKIYSLQYDYAGTLDWIAWVTSCGDPTCCPFSGTKLALGDFKSSKAIYEEYIIQTTAYVKAYEEEINLPWDAPTNQDIELRIILKLGKEDGQFESKVITRDTLEDDFNAFLGALTIYNWVKQNAIDSKYDKEMAKYTKKVVAKPSKVILKEVKKETA